MKEKRKNNRNEKIIGFIYVFLSFSVTTFICCGLLFYRSENNFGMRKEFVISKMGRIREFQNEQKYQNLIIDSIYNKIKKYNSGISAVYEENDIKFYLEGLKKLYENNSYDGRYKAFHQISDFYSMWLSDKKELRAKDRNVIRFKKNLEDCEIGLNKKEEKLRNTKQ